MSDNNKLLEQAANARLVHMNEQLIFPLLEKRMEERIASLCESFKAKGEVQMADVGYIAACRDLIIELNSVARHGDKAAEKLNMNPPV